MLHMDVWTLVSVITGSIGVGMLLSAGMYTLGAIVSMRKLATKFEKKEGRK
jgi:hypothetical protein